MVDVKGYEGLYAVTSCGRVWSYQRKKFLNPIEHKNGYLGVNLYKDGERKRFYIHRLVAQAYIPNPDNLPQVNHKDENRQHNWVQNLEFCDAKYNNSYGTRLERIAKANWKKILCVELDRVFDSLTEAWQQTGIHYSNISHCCNGEFKTAGGYHWKYVEERV